MITTTISSINSMNATSSESIRPSLKGILQSTFLTISFSVIFIIFAVSSIKNVSSEGFVAFLMIPLLPLGACAWEFVNLIFTRYELQNSEIRINRPFLSASSQTIEIAKINSVRMKQNPLDRLLGIGNILIAGICSNIGGSIFRVVST